MAEPLLDMEGPAAPPRKNGELVFEAPWESRAFGMTVALQARGLFAWDDFRASLIEEIRTWEREAEGGGEAQSWSYYACWLAALERLLVKKGLCELAEIDEREAGFRARVAGHDH